MMFTWVMPRIAAEKLRSQRTGAPALIEAITAAGHTLAELNWTAGPVIYPPKSLETVVAYGGHPFLAGLKAARPDLADGIFHDPVAHSYGRVSERLGGLMLSADAQIVPLARAREIILRERPLFVRPDLCEKAFAGGVYDRSGLSGLPAIPDLPVVIATPVRIRAGYRIIMADGVPVTGCQYRRDDRLDVRIDIRDEALDTAARAASIYAPARLFTCDIAETDEGYRVVEYNSFSSSGLYACDGRRIVRAAERIMIGEAPDVRPF